jgi:hypothetical protein
LDEHFKRLSEIFGRDPGSAQRAASAAERRQMSKLARPLGIRVAGGHG